MLYALLHAFLAFEFFSHHSLAAYILSPLSSNALHLLGVPTVGPGMPLPIFCCVTHHLCRRVATTVFMLTSRKDSLITLVMMLLHYCGTHEHGFIVLCAKRTMISLKEGTSAPPAFSGCRYTSSTALVLSTFLLRPASRQRYCMSVSTAHSQSHASCDANVVVVDSAKQSVT